MNPRGHMQPYLTNSLAIRQEIQRFESVHPSIYAIYDLIEAIPDPLILQQIREHVVSIEDSFVNSQEWTLSRSVPDLKLGILGTINSGKSALVHRYLTGAYMQEESPEGGRFKKEVVIDGQSYLLLIRDEGGSPEMQFTHWVDAIIFVFSLENETSFNAIYHYYAKMAHCRNPAEVPIILVGTQDAISESNPRVIDDSRARKLATDLKRCTYYETCATYGLNVERVFQDACQKINQAKAAALTPNNSRPSTPNHPVATSTAPRGYHTQGAKGAHDTHSTSSQSTSGSGNLPTATPSNSSHSIQGHSPNATGYRDTLPSKDKDHKHDKKHRDKDKDRMQTRMEIVPHSHPHSHHGHGHAIPVAIPVPPTIPVPPPPDRTPPQEHVGTQMMMQQQQPQKKGEEEAREKAKTKNGEVGSGRVIPCKQGFLYKKSSNPLNKEWKKKYVTLLDDGRLTYHPSLHDYMDDVHAKVINLVRTTVKVPGQRPRGSKTVATIDVQANGQMNNVSGRGSTGKEGTTFDILRDGGVAQRIANCEDGSVVIPNSSLTPDPGDSGLLNGLDYMMNPPPATPNSKIETPNVKKRHRRAKSGTNKVDPSQDGDSDGYEFVIVSLDNKSWHFEAQNVDEREEWVMAIEQQILSSLQANMATESGKSKTAPSRPANTTDPAARQLMRAVKGNDFCVDCSAPNPDWASLNLGVLMCIECSGIHRNLGTHLSRVRSVDLDEWPPDLVLVMTTIGNTVANTVWEANIKGRTKPTPTTPREEKEIWIRAKYEAREFLPAPPYLDVPLPQQLIDAVARQDVQSSILVLAYAKPEHVNTPYSKQDTRTAIHIAAALGNVTILQLLVWYGANVKAVDHHGRNALWYARTSQSQECVELLRIQGCPENPTLPRRRGSQQPGGGATGGSNDVFDQLPASII